MSKVLVEQDAKYREDESTNLKRSSEELTSDRELSAVAVHQKIMSCWQTQMSGGLSW